MPRPKTIVKKNSIKNTTSPGAIDLHFHGAFGIDIMTATPEALDDLCVKLWKKGVAGFCATTLSTPPDVLKAAVKRLGNWIKKWQSETEKQGAIPLGIHLEGPFISSHACGAHPPGSIRPLSFEELEDLWETSQKTLKILTIAPEVLSGENLKKLVKWAKKRDILLSLGHSRATEEQAQAAFDAGFAGVTHAWNALAFHHRSPGVMGAALGRPDVHLELIIDQAHVAPTLIRWTQKLHPAKKLCFVSDCVPAAATQGEPHGFGPLTIRFEQGACRLPDGALAGGGVLLPQAVLSWVSFEAKSLGQPALSLLRTNLPGLFEAPLAALGVQNNKELTRRLKKLKIRWEEDSRGRLRFLTFSN